MSNKNEPLWVYLKAFDEGKVVQYLEQVTWCNVEDDCDIIQVHQQGLPLRIKFEQTEAEEILAEWKGKKITYKGMTVAEWFRPESTASARDDWIVGSNSNGDKSHTWPTTDFKLHDWQEYKAPGRKLMSPADLAGRWIRESGSKGWELVIAVSEKMVETLDLQVDYDCGVGDAQWCDTPGGEIFDFYGNLIEGQDHE